jgi:hypothetical protein
MKPIYWVEVLEREYGSLNSHKVVQEYPFPDVEFEPFGFNLALFEQQIFKIEDKLTRFATHRRFRFIIDIWHPKNYFRVVIKPWKYKK